VRFAIDRAGLVGADGATHAGSFDIAYLGCLPDFTLMAAADEVELQRMLATCHAIQDGPSAVRYPRGEGLGLPLLQSPQPLTLGRGRVLREGADVAILSYGGRLQAALDAAEMLAQQDVQATVADARFAKPLDQVLIAQLLRHHPLVVTVEEGSLNGFGALVMQHALNEGLLDGGQTRLRSLTLPDLFQDHDAPEAQYAAAGLSADGIADRIRGWLAGEGQGATLLSLRSASADGGR